VNNPAAPNVLFQQADIQNFRLPSELADLAGTFDVVFSSAVYHWCKANPGAVIEAAKMLLKPGGRFVWEMGGFGNWWVSAVSSTDLSVGVRAGLHDALKRRNIDPAPLDPWYFPTAKTYSSVRDSRELC
jgi:SAM-dependent methyltransferase